jgi:uncharacterized protein YecT (DUF1311 family)
MRVRLVVCPVVFALSFVACSSDSPKASSAASTSSTIAPRTVSAESDCDGSTTSEIEGCAAQQFDRIERVRVRLSRQLISAAVQPEPLQPYTGTLPHIKNEWRDSEQAFLTYRDHACTAAFAARYPGTWAGIDEISCKSSLTRTHIAFLRAALEGKGNFP